MKKKDTNFLGTHPNEPCEREAEVQTYAQKIFIEGNVMSLQVIGCTKRNIKQFFNTLTRFWANLLYLGKCNARKRKGNPIKKGDIHVGSYTNFC